LQEILDKEAATQNNRGFSLSLPGFFIIIYLQEPRIAS